MRSLQNDSATVAKMTRATIRPDRIHKTPRNIIHYAPDATASKENSQRDA